MSANTSQLPKCAMPGQKIKFHYPYHISPGDLEQFYQAKVSFLDEDSAAHTIFIHILPLCAGIIVFAFFLLSSSFIIYGVVRHIYTDHMLPKRRRTLRRLGKLPEEKRRKKYRRRQSNAQLSNSTPPLTMEMEAQDTVHNSSSKHNHKSDHRHKGQKLKLRAKDDHYYMEGLSDTSSHGHGHRHVHDILSHTSPPIPGNKAKLPPSGHKPLIIPGAISQFPNAPAGIPKGTSTIDPPPRMSHLPPVPSHIIPHSQNVHNPEHNSDNPTAHNHMVDKTQVPTLTLTRHTGDLGKPPRNPVYWNVNYNSDNGMEEKTVKADLQNLAATKEKLREKRKELALGHVNSQPKDLTK